MRAKLRWLHSPDVYDLEGWRPEDPRHFGFFLQAGIGPADSDGENSFDLMVCSPSWFEENLLDTGIRHGEHTLFVACYDFAALRRYIERYVHACEADTWDALARELGRLGHWEYAGYKAG